MRFAVLSKDGHFIENVIVANADQKEQLEQAMGCMLTDASPLGLSIGDFYNGTAWTRNVDGEQVLLPIGDSADAEELLAILEGGEIDGTI